MLNRIAIADAYGYSAAFRRRFALRIVLNENPYEISSKISMKRYAAVKVRGAGAPPGRRPWEPDAGTGGLDGGPQMSPLAGPSLLTCLPGAGARGSTAPDASRLPRKEVIQPHLPVRLPCYDFTPLTLHTFDASAP